VQLRRRIAVHGPGTVVLERRRDPPPRRLGRPNVAEPGLDEALGLIEGDLRALPMRFSDPFIAADECRERHALRRREGRVPARAVLHRAHGLTLSGGHQVRGVVPNEYLVGDGMVPVGEALKVLLVNGAREPPRLRELTVPFATNLLASRVVVLAGVAELFRVILRGLPRTERLGDRQHGRPPRDR